MLPIEVLRLVASYCEDTPLTLHPCLEWNDGLLENPYAAELIHDYLCCHPVGIEELQRLVRNPNPDFLRHIDFEQYPELIPSLCCHPSEQAMALVQRLPQNEWDGFALSSNPCAIPLLSRHPEFIYLDMLAKNPNGYELLRECLQRNQRRLLLWQAILSGIHGDRLRRDFPHIAKRIPPEEQALETLCFRSDPEAEVLLLQWMAQHERTDDDAVFLCHAPWPSVLHQLSPQEYVPEALSANPVAIDYLLQNREFIRWKELADNPSPRVMEVVLTHLHSFLASKRYNEKMYKRREVLVVDTVRYQMRVEKKVKILSQY